ncbi:hypothetical protein [Lichenicoccus sp.]|uniref:hypothetical protein n=1 Tax=Lichenicoccus sp. TaxID=2781899 RepID=UPI003D11F0B5
MRHARLLTAGLLAGFGGWTAEAAPRHHHPHHHAGRPTPPPPTTENLVVHGQKRFLPAPVPNPEIHDPAAALRDSNTGAAIGRFGGAYNDANPLLHFNTGPASGQNPIQAGVPR